VDHCCFFPPKLLYQGQNSVSDGRQRRIHVKKVWCAVRCRVGWGEAKERQLQLGGHSRDDGVVNANECIEATSRQLPVVCESNIRSEERGMKLITSKHLVILLRITGPRDGLEFHILEVLQQSPCADEGCLGWRSFVFPNTCRNKVLINETDGCKIIWITLVWFRSRRYLCVWSAQFYMPWSCTVM
jgi:hypothetical protein